MESVSPSPVKRLVLICTALALILAASIVLGISVGSTGNSFSHLWALMGGRHPDDALSAAIIWRIRFPRVILACLVGATLALGGLVFQALLRNPLAEPYILGISGGSAVGAILAILLGLSPFPGMTVSAFGGSMITLVLILVVVSGRWSGKKDSLILAGVMVNAFCSAVIMFLISIAQDSRIHNILFWLMGDLSLAENAQVGILALFVIPGIIILVAAARPMNLLLLGEELAASMGLNVRAFTLMLVVVTSLMVSATVCQSGLLGFVGLVVPHLLRLLLGPDHRILAPACVLAGASYLVMCDLLARCLPAQGEMPVGVITALVGAPLFIILLQRSSR